MRAALTTLVALWSVGAGELFSQSQCDAFGPRRLRLLANPVRRALPPNTRVKGAVAPLRGAGQRPASTDRLPQKRLCQQSGRAPDRARFCAALAQGPARACPAGLPQRSCLCIYAAFCIAQSPGRRQSTCRRKYFAFAGDSGIVTWNSPESHSVNRIFVEPFAVISNWMRSRSAIYLRQHIAATLGQARTPPALLS